MANPGYPQQMGQMPPGMGPPMGGPPMGGPPMGGPPMRPTKQGVSKAVPVVVSAGLAVGVFCGLLFGVGTGKKDAAAAPSKGTNAAAVQKEDTTPAVPPGETQNKIIPTAQIGKGSAAGSASGSGAGSAVAAAGSAAGSGSAAAAAPMTKLTIAVQPDAAAKVAKIQIDGKAIDGNAIELPFEAKKSIKISVTADGFHSRDQKVDLLEGEETVQLELTKKSGGASPGFGGTDAHRPTVPTRPPGGDKPPPKKKQPGGLIDI